MVIPVSNTSPRMRQSASFRAAPGGRNWQKWQADTKSGAAIDLKKHALMDGAVIAGRTGDEGNVLGPHDFAGTFAKAAVGAKSQFHSLTFKKANGTRM